MLLEGYEPEPVSMPVDSAGVAKVGGIPRLWNITLHFLHYDPPPGGAERGHNLVPHPTLHTHYLVHAKGDVNKFKYDSYDYDKLFLIP